MYHEVSIKHDYLTERSEVKSKVDKILVNNENTFSAAEYKALRYGNDNWEADNFDNKPDVTAMKRSRIYEFTNRPKDGEKIYLATLDAVFIDESNGKEKHTKYLVAVYADDITKAKKAVDDYLLQMQDFTLTDLNETKFLCVVE